MLSKDSTSNVNKFTEGLQCMGELTHRRQRKRHGGEVAQGHAGARIGAAQAPGAAERWCRVKRWRTLHLWQFSNSPQLGTCTPIRPR